MTDTPPSPPRAEKRDVVIERFGVTRTDSYGWLRDPDWQRVMREPEALAADIRAHLEAENRYTEATLEPLKALRETLFAEMRARIREDDSSVPAPDGDWAYYHRFVAGGQHPLYCRCPPATLKDAAAGDAVPPGEQVLLDGNAEATGKPFFKVAGAAHSPDHARFAWAEDLNGSEYHVIRIREAGGATLPDRMEDARGDFVWANDGETLLYTVLDENHRPRQVMRHRIGTDAADDTVVYRNEDPGFMMGVGATESRRFLVIEVHDHADTSEVLLVDADAPESDARVVVPRRTGIRYEVGDHGERLFVLTNDRAIDFRVVEAPLADPRPENWRDVVPHREGCLILHMLVFRDWLVRLEREAGLPRIVVRAIDSGEEHEIAFDEETYQLGLVPGYEFATDTLRFTYSSLATPARVFDYDMRTRERTLRKEQEIPSGHDPARYISRRVFAASHDGVQVPVSLLYAKDTPLDGSAPLLLYGYGSYGHAIPAAFQPNRFSLVDRGFVYAIAHIRGGTDNGYGWYLDGKLMRKRNTFLDFIAAGEHLAKTGFTSVSNIVAHGGSAGGMLVGAAANIRPELFRAIVAEVPFVDVINTMCDATLPLTPPEWVEWGNPIEEEAAYLYMASYCPYTNVRRAAYPHVLATGGLTDPRVTYWEPAKWVARLREMNTDEDSLILLRINMEAGHGGASGRFDRLKEVALAYGFALMVCGKAEG
ncbi:MAG: prolyl oligopeptidase family serine peptidase [Alphaproteobacteria bacterium]|nr:prolyl oligopeptidase family serine peptidase [Alphaproteobacteria bacterium]